MTPKKLIKQLLELSQDQELNFLVWDGDDNHNVSEVNFNEYDSCIDMEFTLDDNARVIYINTEKEKKSET